MGLAGFESGGRVCSSPWGHHMADSPRQSGRNRPRHRAGHSDSHAAARGQGQAGGGTQWRRRAGCSAKRAVCGAVRKLEEGGRGDIGWKCGPRARTVLAAVGGMRRGGISIIIDDSGW